MPAFKVLDVSIDERLDAFSAFLRANGVAHHIYEDSGRQVLLVGDEAHVALVREAFARWRAGGLDISVRREALLPGLSLRVRIVALLLRYPLTLLGMALGLSGFAVVELDTSMRLLRQLSFSEFHPVGIQLVFESASSAYARGEYWRLLTPVFLHFGLMHISFNLLWFWELGRRLERARGSLTALAVLVLTGAGGNIVQYLAHPDVMFGGLSGVIYGLLGYAWMWNRQVPEQAIALPPGVLGFMLVWLLICMSGIVEAIGFGAIANAAHLSGLVLGMLLGLGAALLRGRDRNY